ncbi:MAG: methyltransferase domain-containing protein [Anaerolineales bacterium]
MGKILSIILIRLAQLLDRATYERLLVRLVQRKVKTLPPDEALRFLFRLDAAFYGLQGTLAVAYGGGKHTKHRHTSYHEFFVSRIFAGERVLDVGCGTGDVAYDLVAKSKAVVDGIDLSLQNIVEAKRRYSHPDLHYAVQDAMRLETKILYDVVLLSNVLEHLNGRPQFLRDMVEMTKAKRVFVRVPLFERDWRVPLKKELGVEWRLDEDHKIEYTLQSFHQEIDEAGLRPQHIEVRWGEIWSELVPVSGK